MPKPATPTYPVRLILELADQAEHDEWFAAARAEGLDLDAWVLRVVRAARSSEASER